MHHSDEQLVDANRTPEDEELHIEKITGDKLLCPLTKVGPLKKHKFVILCQMFFGACGHFFYSLFMGLQYGLFSNDAIFIHTKMKKGNFKNKKLTWKEKMTCTRMIN